MAQTDVSQQKYGGAKLPCASLFWYCSFFWSHWPRPRTMTWCRAGLPSINCEFAYCRASLLGAEPLNISGWVWIWLSVIRHAPAFNQPSYFIKSSYDHFNGFNMALSVSNTRAPPTPPNSSNPLFINICAPSAGQKQTRLHLLFFFFLTNPKIISSSLLVIIKSVMSI